MRLFNAFQVVCLFAAAPFLISYLWDADFRGASAAFYATCVAYLVAFLFMIRATEQAMKDI